ncbi:MAG TPA: AraC family transcriptional regulator [Steroidobacter sp.]
MQLPLITPESVHRAENYIQQHLTENIRLDDIVSAAGVPARTLHYGFKRFRSSTPMRLLRQKRFEQARQDLLAGARDGVQVMHVAHRYWMHHGGRFAINYQKQFGETPSATLRSALKQSAELAQAGSTSSLSTFLQPLGSTAPR